MTDVKIKCDNCKFVENCVDYGWQECKKFTPKPREPMTKLCNTCEYLKFCARSGIEDVGCDRYQKDTTTNEEWLRQANTEQLAEFIADVCYELVDDICANYDDTSCDYRQTEKDYWVEWLKQPHK